MTRLTSADLLDDGEAACVGREDGAVARFHAIRLRDNVLDPATRSASTIRP